MVLNMYFKKVPSDMERFSNDLGSLGEKVKTAVFVRFLGNLNRR